MQSQGPQLTESIDVGSDIDAESWRLAVPGRAACYLLEDGDGRPIIAATVGDLRSAIVRRLGPDPEPVPGEQSHRKIDYRAVTRRVRWRPVFSRFEGNWTYLELVRDRFPQSYRKLIQPWRAWWVCVDERDPHPRFDVRDRPMGSASTCFGPFATQKAGRRHVQMLEDLFDLCRYHHILVQAPHAQACAYKQMGRCPAPCDGTVTMDAYRSQIAAAIGFVRDPAVRDRWRADVTDRMKRAAGDRDYEAAARCKAMLDTSRDADAGDAGGAGGVGGAPSAAFVRPLDAFRFVSLQRGDRKARVRAFVIDGGAPGIVEYAGQVEKSNRDELLSRIADRLAAMRESPVKMDEAGAQRIGLVAWHLLAGKREIGVWLRADDVPDAASLAAAIDAFTATPGPPGPPDEESDTPGEPAADVDAVSSESAPDAR